jgi:hypothetical protein
VGAVIEEHWDPTIADGLDLGEGWGPDFEAGDTVCFKDWPDFTYTVDQVDGDKTYVENPGNEWYLVHMPTAALRKVIEEPRPDPEEREVDVDSELTLAELVELEAVQRAIENLEQVNQRLRDN